MINYGFSSTRGAEHYHFSFRIVKVKKICSHPFFNNIKAVKKVIVKQNCPLALKGDKAEYHQHDNRKICCVFDKCGPKEAYIKKGKLGPVSSLVELHC